MDSLKFLENWLLGPMLKIIYSVIDTYNIFVMVLLKKFMDVQVFE